MKTHATWVLLRGLTREAAHWGDFPSQLESRLPGSRIVRVDLPGCGVHHAQRSPTTIGPMVEAIRDGLARSGSSPPYMLLALSLGGMVAVDWATRRPEELAGVVIVNSSFAGISPLHRRLRYRAWPTVLNLLTVARLRGRLHMERAVLRLTSAQPERHPDVPAAWAAIRAARPVSAANALRQLLAAARFRAPESPPALPLLLVAGVGDQLVDPGCSIELAGRWGVQLITHPLAGHDLPLDDGAWLAQQVVDWWTKVGGRDDSARDLLGRR